jgi:hypothetical protein
VVTTAGQHPHQPACQLDVVVVTEFLATQLVTDQLLGALTFGPGVDVGQRGGDHLAVDTLVAQLGG